MFSYLNAFNTLLFQQEAWNPLELLSCHFNGICVLHHLAIRIRRRMVEAICNRQQDRACQLKTLLSKRQISFKHLNLN